MGGRIIQVPVEEDLLSALDALARKDRRSRAEIIRAACRRYLRRIEEERLDQAYVAGYQRAPEDPGAGQAQAAVAGRVLPAEEW